MQRLRLLIPVVIVAFLAGAAFWRFGYSHLQTANILSATSNMPPESVEVSFSPELLVGTWTSADDPEYQITYLEDGSITESYAGASVGEGKYHFSNTPREYVSNGEGFPLGTPTTYLLQEVDGERYAYKLEALAAGSLVMSYLERGSQLTFTR